MANSTNPKEQLAEIIKSDSPPGYVLVVCPDEIRAERVIQQLMKSFFSDLSIKPDTFSGAELRSQSLSEISNATQETSLFARFSLTVLNGIDALNAAQTAKLAEILPGIADGACLLMTARSLPAKNKVKTLAKSKCLLIEIPALKGDDLTKWIAKEAREAGLKKVPTSVISGIASLSGGSLDTAISILAHCALFSSDGNFSHADLELLYPEAPQQNEFELIDLLHSGNEQDLEIALQRLWHSGKNAFMFLGLLTSNYSRYLAIRSLLDQGNAPAVIRQIMGMKEWVFNKHLQIVKRKSFARLQRDFQALLLADSKLKNRSLGEPEVIAELSEQLRSST